MGLGAGGGIALRLQPNGQMKRASKSWQVKLELLRQIKPESPGWSHLIVHVSSFVTIFLSIPRRHSTPDGLTPSRHGELFGHCSVLSHHLLSVSASSPPLGSSTSRHGVYVMCP